MNPEIHKNQRPEISGKQRTRGMAGLFGIRRKTETDKYLEEKEILRCVADAWNEWQEAGASFEHVFEEKLVDYYTYKMKASEARYSYFVGLAKERGLSACIFNGNKEASRQD